MIKSITYKAMSIFIPKIQTRSKHYPKWFTKDLRHQLKCLHTLRRKNKRSPSVHNATRLSHAEDMFQRTAAEAKSTYETALITNYTNFSNPAMYHYT